MTPIKRQSTLAGPAVCAGIEIHGGEHTRIAMRPAPVGTGIVFIRTDIEDRDNHIFVTPEAVSEVKNGTTLQNAAGVTVATIEHLMAALAAVGVDNVFIDIDGNELPALDGSSEPFLRLIEQVGIVSQPAPRRYVKILKPIEVEIGQSTAKIEPADQLELDVSIEFDNAVIGSQRIEIQPNERSFREKLASARTFAENREFKALLAAGLSKGGSLENAILVEGDKVLNPEGLRFDDEFVRHKALDLLGDLYMSGPILGRVTTVRGGHRINHKMLTALFADPEAWKFVSLRSENTLRAQDSALA